MGTDRFPRIFPFLQWFPMDRKTLRADLIAGVTVALVLIPQSMAYAELAGLPPYYGLYAALIPGIIAALWGSSKLLATGPVAVVSLLTASSLTPFADVGSPEFPVLAIMMALLVGLIQLTFGVLRLGSLINLLSHSVILGFVNAAALIIGLSQLNKIFGIAMPHSGHFANDIWVMLQGIGNTHVATLVMGVSALTLMLAIRKIQPKFSGVLVAVAVTTFASWAIGFEAQGGKVVGEIPPGLPALSIPQIDLQRTADLISSAIIIAMIGFLEAISIAKAIAAKTGDQVNPNQELIGQGLANVAGSLSQAFPSGGSFSRTAVNLNAGAVTGMSSVFTGAVVLITLLFLTPLFYHLPESVLAAVVMMAVTVLISFKAIKQVWKESKQDGVVVVVTFAVTLGFAPHLNVGILAGAGLALGLYLYRTLNPRSTFTGRLDEGSPGASTEDESAAAPASRSAQGQVRDDAERLDERRKSSPGSQG